MVLPTVESDRETDDFARWKGSAGPGISCTPVDVQSPFPMSIPTVKSSRRRAPCHDYPHLATAHRPPPPIIPADRRIIYEARCDTESSIEIHFYAKSRQRSFVLSRFRNARLSSNFRFVSFRDYLDEARAKLKFDRRRLSRSFEDYLLFLFFFFFWR